MIDQTRVNHRWNLEKRDTSGLFAVSRSGALLFRVELAVTGATVYAWDKKANCEIPVSIDELLHVLTFYGKPL